MTTSDCGNYSINWLRLFIRVCLLALGLSAARPAFGHDATSPVILDTDMALDDARALALLLSSPQIAVKAIITSDGACPPSVGATNVARILRFFEREKIVIGSGLSLGKPAPPWAERSTTLGWSELPASTNATIADATTALRVAFHSSTNQFTWICLGPLSNLAGLLDEQPELASRIARVLYCGGLPDSQRPGWNTTRDPDAVRKVIEAGVPVVSVQPPDEQTLVFDAALLGQISTLDSPGARLIVRMHENAEMKRLLEAGHFRASDETVVLTFLDPSFGHASTSTANTDANILRAAYLDALRAQAGGVGARPLVTLQQFPAATAQFQPDLQPLVDDIIKRYGVEEWKINVLTSELHRHLGLYSIVGAKMGLRARELLGASLDDLHVESFAGLQPPVSCLNDGLQVATGASLGRGTIRVPETKSPQAAAVFTFGGRTLRMRLRDDAVKKIQGELCAAIQSCGDLTPAYFAEVRRISLEAWRDLDRAKIFEEVLESATKAKD